MKPISHNLTLAQQLRRTFAALGALVAVALTVVALTYAVSAWWLTPELERSRLAIKAASAAHAAILDQENGLRGYLLTHDVSFLEPYTQVRGELVRANEALTQNVGANPRLVVPVVATRVAEEKVLERWATASAALPRDAIPSPSMTTGKAFFDAYRNEHAALVGALDRYSESLSRRQQRMSTALFALVLASFTAVLFLAARQYRALRDSIVAPITELLRLIARVRDGHLDRSLDPAGPHELRRLGEGLNDMVCAIGAAREVAACRETALREHSALLRQILEATREFTESLKLDCVVVAVRDSTVALGGYGRVIIWLMDDERKQLAEYTETLSGASQPARSVAEPGLAARAARSGRITFEDPAGQVRFISSKPGAIRALAIPLIVGAHVIGVLEARHADAQVATVELVEILELLARHAATAIESARLHEFIERRSQTDALTQLYNRRRLDEDLATESQCCVRYGRPLALVMLDLDHFKAFNDSYGHPKADLVLQQVAALVVSCLRTTDTAYRYGGEEFCILMRETSAEDAINFAERARREIEQRFASGELVGITASFGVAGFSAETPQPTALLEAADEALYQSKNAGRNRVMLSSRPRSCVSAAPMSDGGFRAQA
jgi:diguanylate cyclase (GGDEF)-like protein